jgi:hypothetical protein
MKNKIGGLIILIGMISLLGLSLSQPRNSKNKKEESNILFLKNNTFVVLDTTSVPIFKRY